MARSAVIHSEGEAGGRREQVQGEGEGVDGSLQECLRGAHNRGAGKWYSYRWAGTSRAADKNTLPGGVSGPARYGRRGSWPTRFPSMLLDVVLVHGALSC
jgi:hypothetical protein